MCPKGSGGRPIDVSGLARRPERTTAHAVVSHFLTFTTYSQLCAVYCRWWTRVAVSLGAAPGAVRPAARACRRLRVATGAQGILTTYDHGTSYHRGIHLLEAVLGQRLLPRPQYRHWACVPRAVACAPGCSHAAAAGRRNSSKHSMYVRNSSKVWPAGAASTDCAGCPRPRPHALPRAGRPAGGPPRQRRQTAAKPLLDPPIRFDCSLSVPS